MDYGCAVLSTRQCGCRGDRIFAHLGMLSLWAIAGLALTGLAFALGFGAEVAQALVVAG
jgi:hypothetical protein